MTGPLRAPAAPIAIEPDASSAAVLLAAARISGGAVEIENLAPHSAQPDARAADLIARVDAGGADLDVSGSPDLAPVLAAVAAAAALRQGASTRLRGLATLPGKESSRIEVLARGLESLGLAARAGTDALEIEPGTRARPPREVRLDPAGDHRMAFAFALLGLVADGVWVLDPLCVAKSWPGFWGELERLGAHVATSA